MESNPSSNAFSYMKALDIEIVVTVVECSGILANRI